VSILVEIVQLSRKQAVEQNDIAASQEVKEEARDPNLRNDRRRKEGEAQIGV
jgi:hypothetical protein